MEEEEGLGVRRHVDVVLKVSEERAVHHGLRVVLSRKLVALFKREVNFNIESLTLPPCSVPTPHLAICSLLCLRTCT